MISATLLPSAAHASILSDVLAVFQWAPAKAAATQADGNLQTLPLPQPAMNFDPSAARGGGDITVVDDTALVPAEGPSGTIADIVKPKNATITRYVVRPGDTVSSIADLFQVSPSTILWANDLSKGATLQVGQQLIILPVTGVQYTLKAGDTLSSIAKRFGGDPAEIASSNGIDPNALVAGEQIIIPNGEITTSVAPAPVKKSVRRKGLSEPAHNVGPSGTADENSYYIAPLSHYTRSQGIHGYNAVDLAAPVGTPIMAAATGDVVVAKEGGWNGGYGSYVVISHDNGSQTLYAHMSQVATYDGAHVVQGQVIGYVGMTGLATGPHVHFEIRDGIRNPF